MRWLLAIGVITFPAPLLAGMPQPLPDDLETVLLLNDTAEQRLQVISFFLICLLAASGVVMLLWNGLRREFSRLPRLSFSKAILVVIAWGVLFVMVLTMISGARELMTPGAWEKQGATYQLKTHDEVGDENE